MNGRRVPTWRVSVYLLYDLLLLAAGLVLIPYYHLRGLLYGKSRRGVRERLGFYLPSLLNSLRGREVIWIHAVSVGETRAAIPLIKTLRKTYPDAALLLSNMTETGHAVSSGTRELDARIFLPFDLSWVVRKALRRLRPTMILIVETEIWPNLVRLAHAEGIPVILVNGRISDRSFPRYLMGRFLLEPILQQFSFFCMQAVPDAQRILALGAPADRVTITGNLKFDMAGIHHDAEGSSIRERLRLAASPQVWVAGSTHAGEEEAVVNSYLELIREGRELLLILVPRHPERSRSVGEMLAGKGLRYRLRSKTGSHGSPLPAGEVLLVDTVGEMLTFYGIADLVYVGGSLVPVGGHNILEASLMKRPVLFGPHMENFKEIAQLMLQIGGGMQVADGGELTRAVRWLLEDPAGRLRMGEAGFSLLESNQGATEQTLEVIDSVRKGP